MGKACCAPGCVNRFCKGNGIKFYRFPVNIDRRRRWIAAVNRKDWQPSEYSWLCSVHFVTGMVPLYYYYDLNSHIYGEMMFVCFVGEKNDDPNHPDYVPSQFSFLKSPVKAKMKRDLVRYHRSEDIKAKLMYS